MDNTRFLVKLFYGLGYAYQKDFVYYLQPDATHCGTLFAPRFRQMLLWFFGEKASVQKCEIVSPDVAAVAGCMTTVNTLITYSNGVVLSDMDAQYSIEPADALHIGRTGEITACHPGEAVIRYENNGAAAEKKDHGTQFTF